MKNLCWHLVCFSLMVLTSTSCASKKKLKKRPVYEPVEVDTYLGMLPKGPEDIELEMKRSQLNLQYSIDKSTIADTFNNLLDTLLNGEGFYVDEYKMQVNLKMIEAAKIEIEGKSVLFNFPLEILAVKKTILQDVEATGQIYLTIASQIEVAGDWSVGTTTELIDYHWMEKPTMKMGRMSIGIERLMNLIIDRTKEQVITKIDASLKESIQLKDQILSFADLIAKQILLEPAGGINLFIKVDSIGMSSILNSMHWTKGLISFEGEAQITGEVEESKEELRGTATPIFKWLPENDFDGTSNLFFGIEVALEHINKSINQQFGGQTFSEGNHEVTIGALKLRGLDEKLGIIAELTGSYEGQVFISAIPVYDPQKQIFASSDIEINLLTKNVLHKALGWMLQGRIKRELDQVLQVSIKDQMERVQESINEKVEALNAHGGAEVVANIEDLKVEEFRFSQEKIHANIQVPMVLGIKILDFAEIPKGKW